jgi:hypothetical protein
MSEGIRIAGGFGAALRLFGWGIAPVGEGGVGARIGEYQKELERLKGLQGTRYSPFGSPMDFTGNMQDLQKQIQFLQFLQRQQALAGRTGAENLDARDLAAHPALVPSSGYQSPTCTRASRSAALHPRAAAARGGARQDQRAHQGRDRHQPRLDRLVEGPDARAQGGADRARRRVRRQEAAARAAEAVRRGLAEPGARHPGEPQRAEGPARDPTAPSATSSSSRRRCSTRRRASSSSPTPSARSSSTCAAAWRSCRATTRARSCPAPCRRWTRSSSRPSSRRRWCAR